jgi:sugar/nucleoside kinase (ribokinase family)
MRSIYQEDGRELVSMLEWARRQRVTTSLDMALPDPASEAGQLDWAAFLQNVLPRVDLFAPSAEELLFMLDRPLFERFQEHASGANIVLQMDGGLLSLLAEQCLALGAAAVALKLGDQGLYLRTTTESLRWRNAGRGLRGDQQDWCGRELLIPCFQSRVVGTTGAGDATIAGFLTSLLGGREPETVMRDAVAVGAYSVEAADASSAIPSWEAVQQRIAAGWQSSALWLSLPDWRQDAERSMRYGPHDRNGAR